MRNVANIGEYFFGMFNVQRINKMRACSNKKASPLLSAKNYIALRTPDDNTNSLGKPHPWALNIRHHLKTTTFIICIIVNPNWLIIIGNPNWLIITSTTTVPIESLSKLVRMCNCKQK